MWEAGEASFSASHFFDFLWIRRKHENRGLFRAGGGVEGRRIKLYTDNIKYYCNLKSLYSDSVMYIILHSGSVLDIMGLY